MYSLGIVVATSGRKTLKRALESLVAAGVEPRDELLICADGMAAQAYVAETLGAINLPCSVMLHTVEPRANDVGGTPRNVMLHIAGADYITYLDDDDAYVANAFTVIRHALRDNPGRPHLFRMSGPPHGVLWDKQRLQYGKIGGPCFVHPNMGVSTPRWDGKRGQDYRFICAVLEAHGSPGRSLNEIPVWRSDVIYHVRP